MTLDRCQDKKSLAIKFTFTFTSSQISELTYTKQTQLGFLAFFQIIKGESS